MRSPKSEIRTSSKSGRSIIVRTGNTLTLINTDLYACDTLAYGIIVEPGATLIAEGCNFSDSRFAIDAKPGAILHLVNNVFSDNYIGLNLDMSSGSPGLRSVSFDSMANNLIKSDLGLKTPYTGMPEAVEYRGYCGIQLKNYEHFNVGGNQTFSQLANGTIAVNSTGNITDMVFDDMNSVDQSAVYPREGYGIHLLGKGGSYWFNINQTYTTMSFNNFKTGVYAKSYAGRVAGTTMTNVGTGIEWLQSNNRDIFIRKNDITARQFGIKTFLNEPVHSYSIMENNTITVTEGLDDDNNSVGAIEMSELSMGSDPTGPITVTTTADGWEVKGSTITMKKGGNGILYRNGVNGILNVNNINNESEPDNYKGINTSVSYFIGVSNNTKGFAASALASYEAFADTLYSLRMQKVQTLDSLNNLVSTVLTPDANHKTVNAIVFDFLQTDSIASDGMKTLEAIAAQCPLEGGDAVYEARALVGHFTGVQYDDEAACNVQPREFAAENVNIATDFIIVYPNPTTGELRWESLDESISTLRVYNAVGQLQLQQPASDQCIELSGLVDGLYWVQFLDANSKLLATKAVHLTRN